MALIRLDDELDRWIEETAALPADMADNIELHIPSVPVVDLALEPDMHWLDGFAVNAEYEDFEDPDTLNDDDDGDDDDDSDYELPY